MGNFFFNFTSKYTYSRVKSICKKSGAHRSLDGPYDKIFGQHMINVHLRLMKKKKGFMYE